MESENQPLEMEIRRFRLETIIFRFHVKLWGCNTHFFFLKMMKKTVMAAIKSSIFRVIFEGHFFLQLHNCANPKPRLANWAMNKHPGRLGYIGDYWYTTQLCSDYFIRQQTKSYHKPNQDDIMKYDPQLYGDYLKFEASQLSLASVNRKKHPTRMTP